MSDNAKTDESQSTMCSESVDDPRRRRAEYCDARQLLSETLRLRRAAQLQRAAASDPTTTLTQSVSGLRRSAADDGAASTNTTPKRRKKVGRSTDKSRPRARRIMFHEYKGPSEDGAPLIATQSAVSSTLDFTLPTTTTNLFSPSVVWTDRKNEEPHDGSGSGSGSGPLRSFVDSLSADFGCFHPATTSPLPRFSELQRSLRPPLQRTDLADHLTAMNGSRPETVCCSSCPPASVCQPSTLVDAVFCRSTSTMITQLPVTSSLTSSPSTSSVEPYTQSQRCHPLSVTSSIDVTSGLLTSVGVDHVTVRVPSVVAAYRPSNGNKPMIIVITVDLYSTF